MLTTFFKYENRALLSHKDNLRALQNQQDNFYKMKDQLQAKKERLFSTQDTSRWEIPKHLLQRVNPQELLGNQSQAFQVMCPSDS